MDRITIQITFLLKSGIWLSFAYPGSNSCEFPFFSSFSTPRLNKSSLPHCVTSPDFPQPNWSEEPFPADDKGMIIPSDTDFLDTWEAMEKLVDVGMVKVIRISNFSCKQIDGLLSKPDSKYKPDNNQIESHPYLQVELIMFLPVQRDLSLQTVHLERVELPALIPYLFLQVLIQLQIQRNMSVIPRSITPHCTKENLKVTLQNLTLTQRNPPRTWKNFCQVSLLSENQNGLQTPK
uniref:NADP-dependent oxidoreductase domain-containing protein n=1 Tax=Pavo cristatus TaxID=9049 RepID=A0A8C9FIZ2_PAVCR